MASLSVIIPCFNQEKDISECINALLSNDIAPDEIIIVDDCSTDSSVEIIKSYNNSKIKLFKNAKNRGIGYSRTLAIKESSSKILAFCDANSIAHKGWISSIKQKIKGDSDLCVVGNVVSNNSPTSFTRSLALTEKISDIVINSIFGKNAITGHNFAITSSTLDKIGGYGSLPGWGSDSFLYSKLKKFNINIVYSSEMIMYKSSEKNIFDLTRRRFRWGRGSFLSGSKIRTLSIVVRRYLVILFFIAQLVLFFNLLPDLFLYGGTLNFISINLFFIALIGFVSLATSIIFKMNPGFLFLLYVPLIFLSKGISTTLGYYYELVNGVLGKK